MIESTTKTGVKVTLAGVEYCGSPAVQVELIHPQAGAMKFIASGYGEAQGQGGVIGVWKGKRACVTVPREDYVRAVAEARAIGEREKESIRSGDSVIELHYHDGEYLSGHQVFGRAGELLVGLGIAKEVDGWGVCVDAAAVKALGAKFAYPQAAEYARPALEKAQAAEAAREAARRGKFDEAKRTGTSVLLGSWTEGCCEKDFDCDMDIVTQYAMPDGSVRTERTHTH